MGLNNSMCSMLQVINEHFKFISMIYANKICQEVVKYSGIVSPDF